MDTLHQIAKASKVKNGLGASQRTDELSIGLHSSPGRRRSASSPQDPFIPIAEDWGCLKAPAPSQPYCHMSVEEGATPLMKQYLGIFRDEIFYG